MPAHFGILRCDYDELPDVSAKTVILLRSHTVPAKAVLENIAVINKVDKTWSVIGFAESATCLVAGDGSSNQFEAMPPEVKKVYRDLRHMKECMKLDRNDSQKVVVLILHDFKRKGPTRYDISDRKLRNGYGGVTITVVPPDLTQKSVNNLFRVPESPTSVEQPQQHPPDEIDAEPVVASQEMNTTDETDEKGNPDEKGNHNVEVSDGSVVKDDCVAQKPHEPHQHQHEKCEEGGSGIGETAECQDELKTTSESTKDEVNTCDQGTTGPDPDPGVGEQPSNTPQSPQQGRDDTSEFSKGNVKTDHDLGIGDQSSPTPQSPQHGRSQSGPQRPQPMMDSSPGCRSHKSDAPSPKIGHGDLSVDAATDLESAHRWPEIYLNRLASRDPENISVQLPEADADSLRTLARRMQVSSYSTVFSGIDSPGTAFAQLRRAAEAILGTPVHDPEHVHAVEWDNAANTELLCHPFPPTCLYKDIAGFLKSNLRCVLRELQSADRLTSDLEPLIEKNQAVKTYAYCVVHNRECCIKRIVAMLNLTGTICTGHSAMGLNEREEPLIVQECVDTFPRDKMASLLPQYDFTWAVLSPGRHKLKTLAFRSLLNIFSDLFQRNHSCSWEMFFTETSDDRLQLEVDWASGRPESRWRPKLQDHGPPKVGSNDDDGWSAFESSLTTNEFDFYQKYMELFPGGIYSLNQDPSVKPMRNHGKDMCTVISSVNILMSSKHKRWLSLRELPALQGFPTDTMFTYGKPTSSFALRTSLEQQGLPFEAWPSRRACCHQVGNSMHVCISGLCLLFAFSQVKFDEALIEIQEYQRKRALLPSLDQPQSISKKARL